MGGSLVKKSETIFDKLMISEIKKTAHAYSQFYTLS